MSLGLSGCERQQGESPQCIPNDPKQVQGAPLLQLQHRAIELVNITFVIIKVVSLTFAVSSNLINF